MKKVFVYMCICSLLIFTLGACSKTETVGSSVDDALDTAGEAAEQVGEEAESLMDETTEAVGEAVEEVDKDIKDITE